MLKDAQITVLWKTSGFEGVQFSGVTLYVCVCVCVCVCVSYHILSYHIIF